MADSRRRAAPRASSRSDDAQDNEPRFSPDGKWIAFVSKRGEDKDSQLYVIAIDGGEARRVTRIPTGVSAPKWFPDSKRIAFITSVWPDLKSWSEMEQRIKERADSKMTAKVWDKAPFSYWDHFIEDREPHVYAVALEGGDPQPITLGTGYHLSITETSDQQSTTSRPTAPRLRSRPTPIAAASTRTSTCSSCPRAAARRATSRPTMRRMTVSRSTAATAATWRSCGRRSRPSTPTSSASCCSTGAQARRAISPSNGIGPPNSSFGRPIHARWSGRSMTRARGASTASN